MLCARVHYLLLTYHIVQYLNSFAKYFIYCFFYYFILYYVISELSSIFFVLRLFFINASLEPTILSIPPRTGGHSRPRVQRTRLCVTGGRRPFLCPSSPPTSRDDLHPPRRLRCRSDVFSQGYWPRIFRIFRGKEIFAGTFSFPAAFFGIFHPSNVKLKGR